MAVLDSLLNSLLGLLILLVSKCLWTYFRSPLKAFPGPFPTNFTNFWRFLDTYRGRCDITQNELHRKHGPAVRVGPNTISLSDPSLINKIFTTKNPWKKTAMVGVSDVMINGQRVSNLFGARDEDWHDAKVKPLKSLHSMTKVQDFEPNVDSTINFFLDKVEERFVKSGKPCDISDYLAYFAWDAMSWVTFGMPLGLLEAGNDDRGFLKTSSRSLDYFAPVSQMPELDLLFDKNPIRRIGPPTFEWANVFGLKALLKRMQEKRPEGAPDDYLDRFIELKSKHPDIVDDGTVVVYLLSNLLAGSDSTAATMIAAIYYTLRHPEVHQKLCRELKQANASLPVSWKVCSSLPYLDAVMQETMRIHPGIGMMLERQVPKGGLALPDGRIVPEHAIVGMNPWVINRDEEVFGPYPDDFRPERWLQQDDESEEDFQIRRNKMKGAFLTFGSGNRACLGKYLSYLESYKTIGTLFAKYDMALAKPNQEWEVINHWFVQQHNVPVFVKEKN